MGPDVATRRDGWVKQMTNLTLATCERDAAEAVQRKDFDALFMAFANAAAALRSLGVE